MGRGRQSREGRMATSAKREKLADKHHVPHRVTPGSPSQGRGPSPGATPAPPGPVLNHGQAQGGPADASAPRRPGLKGLLLHVKPPSPGSAKVTAGPPLPANSSQEGVSPCQQDPQTVMLTSGGERLALGPETRPLTDQVWSRQLPHASFHHHFDSFMVIFVLMSRAPVCWPQCVPWRCLDRSVVPDLSLTRTNIQRPWAELDRGTRAFLLAAPRHANTG